MSIGRDIAFAGNIREYFSERLGVEFFERPFGFVGYRISGTDLYIDEWYSKPLTPYRDTLGLIRDVVKLGKERGCTRLIGCNETSLATYNDIRKIHVWFKMEHIANNGTQELWARDI